MNSFEKYLPDHIRNLGNLPGHIPRRPTGHRERANGVGAITMMASNENPFGPCPKAAEAIRAAVASASFYPDNESYSLKNVLAEKYSLAAHHILPMDGATALIDIVARVMLAPGRNAITSERTFILYDMAVKATGAEMIHVPMKSDAFDLDGVAAAINLDTRLIFLANPNNPTGTMFEAAALDSFLHKIPAHVMVVLDEAYSDFGEYFANLRGEKYSNSIDYVRQGRNVIVLRTFSKAHGLAGIRVGYGLGHPEFLAYLGHVRSPFSVSTIGEAAAIAALQDDLHIRKTLENNARQAELLMKELRSLGARVVPTSANFIYFEFADDAGEFAGRMLHEGIAICSLIPWGIRNGLRVTIGTPEQNEKFLHAFGKIAAA